MPTRTPATARKYTARGYIISLNLERSARPPALRLIANVALHIDRFEEQFRNTLLEPEQSKVLSDLIFETMYAFDEDIPKVIRLWDECFKAFDDVTLTPLQIVHFKKCSDSMLELKKLELKKLGSR